MEELNIYYWIAESNDGCYQERSRELFTSKEKAYNDMRNAALEKIKWNTEYGEDYLDTNDYDGSIEYKISFSRNKIVHESYSGIYTYQIVEL